MRGLTRVVGIHSVRSALRHGTAGVAEVWLERRRRDRRLAEIAQLARQADVTLRQVDRDEMQAAAAGVNHQGVLAWVRVAGARRESELDTLLDAAAQPPLVLILDGVQDPHNLGACLRTADAAGVDAVIAPKDNAAGLTPVVCKVASGAAESVPYVQVTNLARSMDQLRGRGLWLIGTAGEVGQEIYDADLSGPVGLVMGGEARGLRRLTRERCDLLVRLPMHGAVESLNVSVATGVCLYEAIRQRRPRNAEPRR